MRRRDFARWSGPVILAFVVCSGRAHAGFVLRLSHPVHTLAGLSKTAANSLTGEWGTWLVHRAIPAPGPLVQVDTTGFPIDALDELERPDDHRDRELAARLLAIGHKSASRMSADVKALDHGALLYDDRGLPS